MAPAAVVSSKGAPGLPGSRLVPALEGHNPGETEDIHVVYVGQGAHLPARVRAFLDFLVAHVKIA